MRTANWNPARSPGSALVGLLLGFTLVTPLVFHLLPAAAATFTVTTTADAGPGSLRAAIEAANAAPGSDTILFRIPTTDSGFSGGGVFTLRPASPLPVLEGPTFLDGFSQTGFTGNTNPAGPEIVLNGALAGDAIGLNLNNSNTVRGLVINGFGQDGVVLGGSNNRVEGCFVGTNAAGTAAVPNGTGDNTSGGISSFDNDNVIGGTESRARNVVSGNLGYGIYAPSGRRLMVSGNYVGTNAAGTAALPNGRTGLFLQNTQDGRVGGTAPGARNLVSGNRETGVSLEGGNDNWVQGNYIGTDVRGEVALPNGGEGVVTTQTSGTLVGGTSASARNVISGNHGSGVQLVHTGADRVQGNYIGLNAAGTAALPNQRSGVELLDDGGYLVGGTESGARNIISGNGLNGVSILLDSSNNRIQGNYIGTNPVGRAPISNGGHGVFIGDGARANQVGGTTAGARNLISGNAGDGVRISAESIFDQLPPPTAFNTVQGNFIGTDYSGDRALPNRGNGVSILEGPFAGAQYNLVGGATSGARNLISGNLGHGVAIGGPTTEENQVAGNSIGTNLAGTVALPNGNDGVYISGGAAHNRIGGARVAERNLISGNANDGVSLEDASPGNRVEGNYIGTNGSGSGALPNESGVAFINTNDAVIGGSVPGVRNVISGNRSRGISVDASHRLEIMGNYIGTNALGTVALPNGQGISLSETSDIQIGGSAAVERNVISGNLHDGLSFAITQTTHVLGNYIGVNAAGTGAVPNKGHGIALFDGTRFTTIGGTDPGSRNIISGNGHNGVFLAENVRNTIITGNYVGTNAAGTGALPNGEHGVTVLLALLTRIGGTAAGAGNLISGNRRNGILIWNFGNTTVLHVTEVLGNFIGTNAAGTGAVPNSGHGVELMHEGLVGNRIGGTEPGAANRIAFNFGDGVLLRDTVREDSPFAGNPIRSNSIYENRGLGINLQPVGEPPSTVTPNDPQDPDLGPNRLQNVPVLTSAVVQPGLITLSGTLNSTPNSPFALDFFRSQAPDPSGYGEGQQYLGSTSVTTDASGNTSFTFVATGIGAEERGFFTATATNTATQDTGEFSAALRGSTVPLAQGSFSAGVPVAGPGQITGQVTVAGGAGLAGVRLSLHQPTGGELFSRDWDPNRLRVAYTESSGAFRFGGLPRGRYLLLAYAPGVYFTPRAQWVELGPSGAADVTFTAAGLDQEPPQVTVTLPAAGSQGAGPVLAEGTVSDGGGSGVRAVLVRIQTVEADPALPPRWLDWQTGIWEPKPAPGQTRWAILEATGTGWKVDLPRPAPGPYRLEVQAYDWAGYASHPETTAFQVR